MCYPSMLVPSTTPLSTQMQSVAQSNNLRQITSMSNSSTHIKSISRLLQRIQSSESFSNRNGGGGGSGGSSSSSSGGMCNTDTQGLVPRITQLLDKLHSTRQHLHQAWHVRKLQLDQCFQLRLFEQDAEKVGGSREGRSFSMSSDVVVIYKISW